MKDFLFEEFFKFLDASDDDVNSFISSADINKKSRVKHTNWYYTPFSYVCMENFEYLYDRIFKDEWEDEYYGILTTRLSKLLKHKYIKVSSKVLHELITGFCVDLEQVDVEIDTDAEERSSARIAFMAEAIIQVLNHPMVNVNQYMLLLPLCKISTVPKRGSKTEAIYEKVLTAVITHRHTDVNIQFYPMVRSALGNAYINENTLATEALLAHPHIQQYRAINDILSHFTDESQLVGYSWVGGKWLPEDKFKLFYACLSDVLTHVTPGDINAIRYEFVNNETLLMRIVDIDGLLLPYRIMILQLILSKNIDINLTDDRDETILYKVCQVNSTAQARPEAKEKYLEILKELLKQKSIDVNQRCTRKLQTPLYAACTQNDASFVKELLKRTDIDVNRPSTEKSMTPLYGVVSRPIEKPDIVKELLARKDLVIQKGEPLLLTALQLSHTIIAHALIAHGGIDVNEQNGNMFPLLYACLQRSNFVPFLLKFKRTDPNQATVDTGRTALHVTSAAGLFETVQLLLSRDDIDVNKARTDTNQTPLQAACVGYHVKVVRLLLGHKNIDPYMVPLDNERTPFHIYFDDGKLLWGNFKYERLEIVKELLKWSPKDDSKKRVNVNITRHFDNATPLHHACDIAEYEFLSQLLERNEIDVNQENMQGETPLAIACRCRRGTAIKLLLGDPKTDVNKGTYVHPLYLATERRDDIMVNLLLQDERTLVNHAAPVTGMTPLMQTCADGDMQTTMQLLNHALIDVNSITTKTDGITPLLRAIDQENNWSDIVKLLLNVEGIDVNKARLSDGHTPLAAACLRGHVDTFNRLVAFEKTDVNQANAGGVTPLFLACTLRKLTAMATLFGRKEIDVNHSETLKGETPLYNACKNNYFEVVESLLRRPEIDVNKATDYGCSPLIRACANNRDNIELMLIAHKGIDVNQEGTDREEGDPEYRTTPLLVACENNNKHQVQALVQHQDINVNKIGSRGATPLYVACQESESEVVKLLLAHDDIDVNMAVAGYSTPLYLACNLDKVDCVKELLAHANIDVNKDYHERTPLCTACTNNCFQAASLLLAHKDIDVNRSPFDQWTLFESFLVKRKDNAITILLQSSRTDLAAADENGNTVLHKIMLDEDFHKPMLTVRDLRSDDPDPVETLYVFGIRMIYNKLMRAYDGTLETILNTKNTSGNTVIDELKNHWGSKLSTNSSVQEVYNIFGIT